ncbi:CHAT domain-containing protein [Flavilitoribacter nigricans]|uniref:CHAT domain-containing protein n=1 Tax=Flavilitoribacter nigricans (strain ATCC 23147 / DSM 23189 / NBRC 102662 / NCIMB 1420 / SS-2) TaxID=1122177 RepID=A0A2D0N0D2_FLAN2|nr:CHAT domain-containing protein [Flavilitoribacter nigricans]PHN02012.1 hypothetical protein CRP01_34465 [Flavilitoribacter nigricans DSM 23189 = NBRC 102662]
MPLILLASANDESRPLPNLKEEHEEIEDLLSEGVKRKHYEVQLASSVAYSKIVKRIANFREELLVFHYSGHADQNTLLIDEKTIHGESIADLLGKCPNLQLVILNGCSTAGQVDRLLQLPSKPAVIATNVAIDDSSAKDFAIAFWRALSRQYCPLEEAFKWGMIAANQSDKGEVRGISPAKDEIQSENFWALFFPAEKKSRSRWKLPSTRIEIENQLAPNELLLEKLPEAFAAFDHKSYKKLKKINDFRNSNFIEYSEKKKKITRRNIIIKCLPAPISVQVEKLFCKSENRDIHQVFYDKPSTNRLRQLLLTYQTAMELPAFTMLAQLFDLLIQTESKIQIHKGQYETVNRFLSKPNKSSLLDIYFPTLQMVGEILEQHDMPLFIPELAEFILYNQADFQDAFEGLEKMRQRDLHELDSLETAQSCGEAEAMLACVLNHLSFLANYSMFYVRNISVLYNRHANPAKYLHNISKLTFRNREGIASDDKTLEHFFPRESVLLERKQKSDILDNYLNLAPFVIDENAYLSKKDRVKLHCFDHFESSGKTYTYKHIYDLDGQLLSVTEFELEREEPFAVEAVRLQFNKFRTLIQSAAS